MGAIKDPADAGLAVGTDDVVGGRTGRAVGADERDVADAIDEVTLGTEEAVASAADHCGPIGFKGAEAMFAAEVDVAQALVAVD